MTREERGQELQRLTLSSPDEFFALYRQAIGLPERATIPLGLSITDMIQSILNREYSSAQADCESD
jgi:hypothetical protein